MKWFLMMAVAAMLSVGLNAADLAGAWKGSVETQMGKTDVTITITPGAVLAGTADMGGFQGPIQQAKVEGANISFEVQIEHGTIAFEGTVVANEMKLNVTGTRGDKYALTCTRQK